MLIIDDSLLFLFLRGHLEWLPIDTDPSQLATTYTYQYRLLISALKVRPEGVHSRAMHSVSAEDRAVIRQRLQWLERHLTVLDPRPGVRTASAVSVEIGGMSHLQTHAVSAAIRHNATLALTATSTGLERACNTYGIPIHRVEPYTF
jgi:hypothetical protein